MGFSAGPQRHLEIMKVKECPELKLRADSSSALAYLSAQPYSAIQPASAGLGYQPRNLFRGIATDHHRRSVVTGLNF